VFARYAYRLPDAPVPGNRADAVRAFAEGVQAQKDGRIPEAIAAYQKAAEADPSFFDAQYNLGVAAYQNADWPRALGAYEQALAIQPGDVNARFNFALTLNRARHPVDAANELEKILVNRADDVNAHFTAANLYAQPLAQPQKAREHYLKVLQLEPRHPQAATIRLWLAAHP
jgi:tetratricopeptide (TPR) repeat protein